MCKINVARIVTRAMIYQWVSNIIMPSQWSDAWINQGISSLLAADVIDKVHFLYIIKIIYHYILLFDLHS